jgi:hypothetical protein
MKPSQYTHFAAKFTTASISLQETHEQMAKEGASPEVLDAVTRAFGAVLEAKRSIEFAKLLRRQQLDDQAAVAKDERAKADALRKAESAARKAAKASSKAEPIEATSNNVGPEQVVEGPAGH